MRIIIGWDLNFLQNIEDERTANTLWRQNVEPLSDCSIHSLGSRAKRYFIEFQMHRMCVSALSVYVYIKMANTMLLKKRAVMARQGLRTRTCTVCHFVCASRSAREFSPEKFTFEQNVSMNFRNIVKRWRTKRGFFIRNLHFINGRHRPPTSWNNAFTFSVWQIRW